MTAERIAILEENVERLMLARGLSRKRGPTNTPPHLARVGILSAPPHGPITIDGTGRAFPFMVLYDNTSGKINHYTHGADERELSLMYLLLGVSPEGKEVFFWKEDSPDDEDIVVRRDADAGVLVQRIVNAPDDGTIVRARTDEFGNYNGDFMVRDSVYAVNKAYEALVKVLKQGQGLLSELQ